MIHSDEESLNSFTPESHQENIEEFKNRDNKNMLLLINLFVFNYYVAYSLNNRQQRRRPKNLESISLLPKQFYKPIARKVESERKTRDRNRSKQDLGDYNQTRKIQSMYNLEQPQQMKSISPEIRPSPPPFQQTVIPVMSTPNLDSTQIALALCQRELAQQKLLNFQLLMMIQNFKNITQLQVKEESNIIN